jgi:hypothetical protein
MVPGFSWAKLDAPASNMTPKQHKSFFILRSLSFLKFVLLMSDRAWPNHKSLRQPEVSSNM